MKGITHKVIIFNEAYQNGPLKPGAPFAKIPECYGHRLNAGLNLLEIQRAKNIFPFPLSIVRTLRA